MRSKAINENIVREGNEISEVSGKTVDVVEEIKKLSEEEFDSFLDCFDWRSNKDLCFAIWAIKERAI